MVEHDVMVGPHLPDEQEADGVGQVGRPECGEALDQVPGVIRRADLQDEQVTAMAKTASLKKTSRAGSRSVPNPLPDPAGSSGAKVVAIERNQRIIVPPHARTRGQRVSTRDRACRAGTLAGVDRMRWQGVGMTTEFVRDTAATAAIFGFYTSVWFGWAQERPPPSWRSMLIGGSAAALLLAVAGGVVTWRDWSSGTVFDEDTSRAFGLVVGIEFAVAGLGALALALRRRSDLTPAWVALVVGIHLFRWRRCWGIPSSTSWPPW
jgi:hypothetical protein